MRRLLLSLLLLPSLGAVCGDPASPPAPVLTTILVAPATEALKALGATKQLTAAAFDQNGASMANVTVSWASLQPDIATVNSTGLVTAVAVGTATITAGAGEVKGTALVVVSQDVASIAVTPDTAVLAALNTTVQVSAVAKDANNNAIPGVSLAFSSSDATVISVTAGGLATAKKNGAARVRVTAGTVFAESRLGVRQATTSLGVRTQPGGAAAGAPLETQPVVELRDAGGAVVVIDSSTTVTAAVTGATLGGTTTVTAVGGVATFTNLSVNAPGDYTLSFSAGALPAVSSGPVAIRTDAEFAISATAGIDDDGGNADFDGTNFMMAYRAGNSSGHAVVRVSPNGTVVGSPTAITAARGDPPYVAFDGTRHLVVWAIHGSNTTTNHAVRGQFVNADGTLSGSDFEIAPANALFTGVGQVVYGGGTYLVLYARGSGEGQADFTQVVRTVSPAGVVGSEAAVATGSYEAFNNLAYGGGTFLVGYAQPNAIHARLVSVAGVAGADVAIASGDSYGNVVPVAFNGTDFVVGYTRLAPGLGAGDTFVRLISPGGVAGAIASLNVQATSGELSMLLSAVSVGAGRVFASEGAQRPDGSVIGRGRFLNSAGVTIGTPVTIAAAAGGRGGMGFGTAASATRVLAVVYRFTPGSNVNAPMDGWTNVDLYGRVLVIPP